MNNWLVLVHHAASHHDRLGPVRRACATGEEIAPMLPMNTTPLNERLTQVLSEEHQAEIRRCFAPRPDRGRTFRVRWLLRLRVLPRSARKSSPSQGKVARAEGGA